MLIWVTHIQLCYGDTRIDKIYKKMCNAITKITKFENKTKKTIYKYLQC